MNKKKKKSRVVANQENAKKSTGPTDTSVTRYNARKHCLTSPTLVDEEEQKLFESIRGALVKEFQPSNTIHGYLVTQIARGMVCSQRATKFESDFIRSQTSSHIDEQQRLTYLTQAIKSFVAAGISPAVASNLLATPPWNILAVPPKKPMLSPEALTVLTEKLQRYQSSIAKQLSRDINELERLLRLRAGHAVPPPAVIDVNVHE
jgi:hypothetical protein